MLLRKKGIGVLKEFREVALLEELDGNIGATDEFGVNIKLGDGRPIRYFLEDYGNMTSRGFSRGST